MLAAKLIDFPRQSPPLDRGLSRIHILTNWSLNSSSSSLLLGGLPFFGVPQHALRIYNPLFRIQVLASFPKFCIKGAPIWKIQVHIHFLICITDNWKCIWGNRGRIQWNGHVKGEYRRLSTIEKTPSVIHLSKSPCTRAILCQALLHPCLDLFGMRGPLESSLLESIHSETVLQEISRQKISSFKIYAGGKQ